MEESGCSQSRVHPKVAQFIPNIHLQKWQRRQIISQISVFLSQQIILDKGRLCQIIAKQLPFLDQILKLNIEPIICSNFFQNGQFYTCKKCRIPQNGTSVVCLDCFRKEHHQEHEAECELVVTTGSCDCGNKTYWKQQSFCDNHKRQLQTYQIKQHQFEETKQIFCILIQILCILYQKYLQIKSRKSKFTEIQEQQFKFMLQKIDSFGTELINSLKKINQINKAIQELFTSSIVSEQITYQPFIKQNEKITIQIKYLLMKFNDLSKTGRQCATFYKIIWCSKNDKNFKKQVTIEFFKQYQKDYEFISSCFCQTISVQILTDSTILLACIKDQFRPLIYHIARTYQQNLQQQVQRQYFSYKQYMDNMYHFFWLEKPVVEGYFWYFIKKKGFIELGQFCQHFSQVKTYLKEKILKQINQNYYQIEEFCMIRAIQIINSMGNLDYRLFLKNSILHLFKKITEQTQKDDETQIQFTDSSYLFFTYERLWSLLVYAYFLQTNPQSTFTKITISENPIKSLYQLYKYLNIPKPEDGIYIFKKLFSRLINYFIKVAIAKYQYKHSKYQNNKFIECYTSKNLLFSLDAIMFKIIFKMFKYLMKKQESQAQQLRELKIILDNSIKKFIARDVGNIKDEQRSFKTLHIVSELMSILQECIFSDLPDLVICQKLEVHRKNYKHYHEAYKQYYLNYYQLHQKSNFSFNFFINNLQCLLFFEEILFNQFKIENFVGRVAINGDMKRDRVNFRYFNNLKIRLRDKQYDHTKRCDIALKPYVLQTNDGKYFLPQSQSIKLLYGLFIDYVSSYPTSKNIQVAIRKVAELFYQLVILTANQELKSILKEIVTKRRNNNLRFIDYLKDEQLHQKLKIQYDQVQQEEDQSSLSSQQLPQNSHFNEENIKLQLVSFEAMRKQREKTGNEQNNNTIEINFQQQCILCENKTFYNKHQDQALQNKHKDKALYQFGFVSYGQINCSLQVFKQNTGLYFASCNHFIHKQCFQKLLEKHAQFSRQRCPLCKREYNILLMTEKYIINGSDITIQIANKLTQIGKLSHVNKELLLDVQIFKWIVIFLIKSITIKQSKIYVQNQISLFKNLFNMIIKLRQIEPFRNDQIRQSIRNQINDQLPRFILPVVDQLVSVWISGNKYPRNYQEYFLHNKNLRLIIQIVTSLKKQHFVLEIPLNNKYIYEFNELPDTLADLEEINKGQCQMCKQQKNENLTRDYFFICVTKKTKNPIKYCNLCFNRGLGDLLNKNRVPHVFIKSSTGELVYFSLQNNQKGYIFPSIYVDSFHLPYESSINSNKLDKTEYKLDKNMKQQIETLYYSNNIVPGHSF